MGTFSEQQIAACVAQAQAGWAHWQPVFCKIVSGIRQGKRQGILDFPEMTHHYGAGAGGLGVVATWFLPSTLEDLLALALAGAVGYASILNLPLRRREAKDKLEEIAGAYAKVRAAGCSLDNLLLMIHVVR